MPTLKTRVCLCSVYAYSLDDDMIDTTRVAQINKVLMQY